MTHFVDSWFTRVPIGVEVDGERVMVCRCVVTRPDRSLSPQWTSDRFPGYTSSSNNLWTGWCSLSTSWSSQSTQWYYPIINGNLYKFYKTPTSVPFPPHFYRVGILFGLSTFSDRQTGLGVDGTVRSPRLLLLTLGEPPRNLPLPS